MTAAQATAAWRGITVVIRLRDGDTDFRPACFVFDTPTGLLWVEPSFFDQPVSAPAVHEIVGTVETDGITVEFEGSMSGHLAKYRPEMAPTMGRALDWWLNEYVPASGKTIAEHRADVAASLGLRG